jgi:hypothetical protein
MASDYLFGSLKLITGELIPQIVSYHAVEQKRKI